MAKTGLLGWLWKHRVIAISALLYFLLAGYVNPTPTITIDTDFCTGVFCVSGLPITIDFQAENDVVEPLPVRIESRVLEGEGEYVGELSFENSHAALSLNTKSLMSTGGYGITIYVGPPFSWYNLFIDPTSTLSNIIGRRDNVKIGYPEIQVDSDGKSCRNDGIYYKQVGLRNEGRIPYKCKLMIITTEGNSVPHAEFHETVLGEHKVSFESKFGEISQGGMSYAFDDFFVKSGDCRDRINIEAIPVCIIDEVEVMLPLAERGKAAECRISAPCPP